MKKKTHWYDWLWIASGLYLILGFVNILFAWLGLICFITPLLISVIRGNKAYCNKYCGRGPQSPYPPLDWLQVVPVRVSHLFYDYVFQYAVCYLAGICWKQQFTGDRDPVVDFPSAMAVGLYRWDSNAMGGTVCLWLLQRDADFYRTGDSDYGHV